jgi:twitching motility two-component system response regulator PilH
MPVKKILIVEDSAAERLSLSEFLSGRGFDCVFAADGGEAVAKSVSETPDLILMDVVMPGMNGYAATRTIARDERTRHIPIFICSGKTQETDRVWGMRQGASAYLGKPLNHAELFERIAALP